MKKIFILLVLSILCSSALYAQKIGYTDMEFITSKMPEYQAAQTEMKKFSDKWAKEIQDKFAEIDRMQLEVREYFRFLPTESEAAAEQSAAADGGRVAGVS